MFTGGNRKFKKTYENKNKKNNETRSSSNINNDFADFYQNYNTSNDGMDSDYDNLSEEKSEYNEFQDEERQIDYDYNEDNNYNEIDQKEKKQKTIRILIIAGVILLIAIIALIVFAIIKSPRIKLSEKEISLNVGESKYITFEVVNTEDSIATNFSSEDNAVATIDENGNIVAVGAGTTNIIVSYNVNGLKKNEKCKVTVIGEKKEDPPKEDPPKEDPPKQDPPKQDPTPPTPASCDKAPSLSVTLTNAQENSWTNQDVIVNVSGTSNCNASVSVKYGINCGTSCNYTNVSNNSVTISNKGTSTVMFVAKDSKSNKEVSKSVTIKIDKTPPKISLLPNDQTVFTPSSPNTKRMEICASCTDNESGCKEAKVCKVYSSKATDTISILDNAGNKGTSKSFTVNLG